MLGENVSRIKKNNLNNNYITLLSNPDNGYFSN